MIESRLAEFVRIVEAGSISGAARQLGVPRVSVSRRLASLEEEFGLTLLHRSTRKMALTDAGAELYKRARRITTELEELAEAMKRQDDLPRGTLRVSVPPGAQKMMGRLAAAFLKLFPEITLEMIASPSFVDLVGEGFDAAIRGGNLTDTSLKARRILRSNLGIFAAPQLLERVGTPTSLDDLRDQPWIVAAPEDAPKIEALTIGSKKPIPIRVVMRSNNIELRVHAAAAGLGFVMLPSGISAATAFQGELVEVLPGTIQASGWMSVVWPEAEFYPPKLRCFIDFTHAFMLREMGKETPDGVEIIGSSDT